MTKESNNQDTSLKTLWIIVVSEIVMSFIASGVYLVSTCWNLIKNIFG